MFKTKEKFVKCHSLHLMDMRVCVCVCVCVCVWTQQVDTHP